MRNIEAIFIFNSKHYEAYPVSSFAPYDRYRESYRRDKSAAVNRADMHRNWSRAGGSWVLIIQIPRLLQSSGHLLPDEREIIQRRFVEFRKISEISTERRGDCGENQIHLDLFPSVIRPIFEDDSCARATTAIYRVTRDDHAANKSRILLSLNF